MSFAPGFNHYMRSYQDAVMFVTFFATADVTSWSIEIPASIDGIEAQTIELEVNEGDEDWRGFAPAFYPTPFIQSQQVRLGWRSRQLASMRALTLTLKNASGEEVTKTLTVNNNRRSNTPEAVITAVDNLGSCIVLNHRCAQPDLTSSHSVTYSGVRRFPFFAGTHRGDLNPEVTVGQLVTITAMGSLYDGSMWMLRRRKQPDFYSTDSFRYWRGAWGIAITGKATVDRDDWLSDGLDLEDAIVWTDENVIWADVISGVDGAGLSCAVWVDDDGHSKILFKRAPGIMGPWPPDSEAVTVMSADGSSGIPLTVYRLQQTPSGRLLITHVLLSYGSDNGGETWERILNP